MPNPDDLAQRLDGAAGPAPDVDKGLASVRARLADQPGHQIARTSRWRRPMLAAAACLLLVGTAVAVSVGRDNPATNVRTDDGNATAPPAGPVTFDVPAVESASIAVTSDGVWRIGGLSGAPDNWQADNSATLFDDDGQILAQHDLDATEGKFLFFTSSTSLDDGRTFVLANQCVVPRSENPGCNSAVDLSAFLFDGDTVETFELPDALIGDVGDRPGDGMAYVRGALSGRVVVTRAIESGPDSDQTDTVEAWTIDIESGNVTALEVPNGLIGAEAVCAVDSDVYAAVPVLGADGNLQQVQIHKSEGGEAFAPFTTIGGIDTGAVVGGKLTCLEDSLLLRSNGSPGVALLVDQQSGDQLEDAVELPGQVHAVSTSVDGSRAVATFSTVEDAAGSDVVNVDYFTIGGGSILKTASRHASAGGLHPIGVPLDGSIIDVSAIFGASSGSAAFETVQEAE